MKTLSIVFVLLGVLFASSCHKCYQCKQYCAYCEPVNNNGVVYKICASKDVSHNTIDSIFFAMESSSYNCTLLEEDNRVCDREAKLDEAVDYYQLQDYYCYPQ